MRTSTLILLNAIARRDATIAELTDKVKQMEDELKKREALVLHQKVRKSTSLEKENDGQKKNGEKKSQSGRDGTHIGVSSSQENPLCSICGKSEGHILSYDNTGKPYIEYAACKTFAEKSCRDRSKMIFRKKFCNTCLSPGALYKSNHVCDKQFICGKSFQKDGEERKCQRHVLVCEFHCQDAENVELLIKYKQKVIQPGNTFSDCYVYFVFFYLVCVIAYVILSFFICVLI